VSSEIKSIALLGTGIMGAGIGRNLAKAGLEVRAWNRTRERAEPLAEEGARICDSPSEAVDGADALLTILSDGDAVAEVADSALAAARDDAIWLQMSTVGLARTDEFAERAAEAGIVYVDCPVSGTRKPAEEGKLVVLASGPAEAISAAHPVFEAIGSKTVEAGDEAGDATRLKLVINTWLLSLTAGLAETIAVADSLGVDAKQFLEVIEGGPMDSAYAQMKGGLMLSREYETSFPLRLAHKDARLVVEAAGDGSDLTIARAARKLFAEAEQMGRGDDDMAAVYEAANPREDDRPAAAP
jgi:3-hydroxyisobutyrate dehydrogenase